MMTTKLFFHAASENILIHSGKRLSRDTLTRKIVLSTSLLTSFKHVALSTAFIFRSDRNHSKNCFEVWVSWDSDPNENKWKKRLLAVKFDVVWAFSPRASRNQCTKGESKLIHEKFFSVCTCEPLAPAFECNLRSTPFVSINSVFCCRFLDPLVKRLEHAQVLIVLLSLYTNHFLIVCFRFVCSEFPTVKWY